MNEIIRIHIAKIPYDIEINAKKEIESYIKSLESYAKNSDLLQDIEIRITELLAERGVFANGVISKEDVAAVRKKLGEPKDFMGDDEPEIDACSDNSRIDTSEVIDRKLFRNVDSAVLGGVLSGVASFFRINTLWVRLIFIVLFLASAGTLTLLYILLWIVIPPARTATEKLQMTGRPVTLASIKDISGTETRSAASYERANSIRRIISFVMGTIFLVFSILTIIFTIFAALRIGNDSMVNQYYFGVGWSYIAAYILAILAGLLLSILFAIFASASFSRKFTNKIITSLILIIVFGLAAFGTAVGLISYGASNLYSDSYSKMKNTVIGLPENFKSIKSLSVETGSAQVEYHVDETQTAYLWAQPGTKGPKITVSGEIATINMNNTDTISPIVKIYGPKLNSINVKSGNVQYSSDAQNLDITTVASSSVSLISGLYGKLSVTSGDGTSVDASAVTVEEATVHSSLNSYVGLGTVKKLSVVQPEACPTNSSSSVVVKSVTSGKMEYNSNSILAKSYKTDCGSVTIDNFED